MRFRDLADRHAPVVAAVAFLTLMCAAKMLEWFGVPSSRAAVRAFSAATLICVGPSLAWTLFRLGRRRP